MSTDLIPFWQALLRAPRQVGAIVPAGRFLGQAMVREVLDVATPVWSSNWVREPGRSPRPSSLYATNCPI